MKGETTTATTTTTTTKLLLKINIWHYKIDKMFDLIVYCERACVCVNFILELNAQHKKPVNPE